jgi:hypothetical protein
MGRALFCTLFLSMIALVYSQCPANYYGCQCTIDVPVGTPAAGYGECSTYLPSGSTRNFCPNDQVCGICCAACFQVAGRAAGMDCFSAGQNPCTACPVGKISPAGSMFLSHCVVPGPLCFCHTVLCQALALQGRQDRTAGRSSRAPRARTRKRQARPIAASVHTMQQTPLVLWAVRHVRIAYVTLSRVIHTYLTSTGGDNTVCNNCVPNGGTSGTGSFKLSNCQCMLHGTRACIDNHCRVMPAVYHHSSARSAGGRASASTSAEGADARSAGGQAFANTSAEGADARSAARRRTRQCQRIWRSSRRRAGRYQLGTMP